jgi:hypothetical protein
MKTIRIFIGKTETGEECLAVESESPLPKFFHGNWSAKAPPRIATAAFDPPPVVSVVRRSPAGAIHTQWSFFGQWLKSHWYENVPKDISAVGRTVDGNEEITITAPDDAIVIWGIRKGGYERWVSG